MILRKACSLTNIAKYPILFYHVLTSKTFPCIFFSNPNELMICFHVWDSGFPLCIVPQVFHFPELVMWCEEHFSPDSNSVVLEQLSQIVLKISRESIAKMLGLHNSGFLEQNVITLLGEVLV